MRLGLTSGIFGFALLAVSCHMRGYNSSESSGIAGDMVAVSGQINPQAFNAYDMWRDGKGTPVLFYPAGYDSREGKSDADGVFNVAKITYRRDDQFVGSVTEMAKVKGDVLIYPPKEGRTLSLKFSPAATVNMTHAEAVNYCKKQGLRLPTIQELLDFCGAETMKNTNGLYANHRCGNQTTGYWSASVFSADRYNAWQFNADVGEADYRTSRGFLLGARCVGTP
jgi:hypothetical protein